MSLVVPTGLKGRLQYRQKHTFATLWQITRTDGIISRYTDHDNAITIDLITYSPAGGFNISARQNQDGMAVQDLQIVGMLTSDRFTTADLRAGLYREAEIIEKLVDYRVPYLGPIGEAKYWITDTKFNGEFWEATVEGLTRWMHPAIGNVYSRLCRYELGDSQCTVDLNDFTTLSKAVTDITASGLNNRRVFETDLTEADDVFDFGFLLWTSGANIGIKSEVKTYLNANGKITLHLNTANAIVVGDGFDATQGCDKLKATCDDKFDNFLFFGGFPFMPGMNKAMESPGQI